LAPPPATPAKLQICDRDSLAALVDDRSCGSVLCARHDDTLVGDLERGDRALVPSRRRMPVRRGDRTSGQVMGMRRKTVTPKTTTWRVRRPKSRSRLRISNNSRDRQRPSIVARIYWRISSPAPCPDPSSVRRLRDHLEDPLVAADVSTCPTSRVRSRARLEASVSPSFCAQAKDSH